MLFAREVNFLGYVGGGQRISPDPAKVESIHTWPVPLRSKDVQTFFGLWSYYRRFVPNFAEVARCWHELTWKDNIFSWSVECQGVFTKLKSALQTGVVLGYPDPSKPCVLDTDGSNSRLGAVLS